MWTYRQSTGELSSADGKVSWKGYSGCGLGKNNPALQNVHNIGPIPRGRYTITGPECTRFTMLPTSSCPVCEHCGGVSEHHHGQFVLRLHPAPGNEMFGRDAFLIHGDNPTHTASQGCIIMPRTIREMVAPPCADLELQVIM